MTKQSSEWCQVHGQIEGFALHASHDDQQLAALNVCAIPHRAVLIDRESLAGEASAREDTQQRNAERMRRKVAAYDRGRKVIVGSLL